MTLNDKLLSKKTYHSPELHLYGDIRELTQALSKKGMKDGARKTKNKKS